MKTVKSIEGTEIDIKAYQKSLNEFGSRIMPWIDEDGRTALLHCTYNEPVCGCKIEGCGTLQFPLTIKFCEKHSAVNISQ